MSLRADDWKPMQLCHQNPNFKSIRDLRRQLGPPTVSTLQQSDPVGPWVRAQSPPEWRRRSECTKADTGKCNLLCTASLRGLQHPEEGSLLQGLSSAVLTLGLSRILPMQLRNSGVCLSS